MFTYIISKKNKKKTINQLLYSISNISFFKASYICKILNILEKTPSKDITDLQ